MPNPVPEGSLRNEIPATPTSLGEALWHLVSHPYELLVRRWNWKSALLSALLRGGIYFFVNLKVGLAAASAAMLTEWSYRVLTAGALASATQSLRQVKPAWQGAVAVAVLIPLVSHSLEYLVHWLRGTAALNASIAASIAFTVVSYCFQFFIMRQDVLIVGPGSGSLMSDLARLPGTVLGILAAPFRMLTRALCVPAFLLLPLQAASDAAPPRLPNVLFITIDTLRADHLSSYGYHLKTSPNIDRLAEQGVRYEHAYTVTSRTGPSHYSMFTSRYPQEHGAKLNGFAVAENTKFLFLPQILRRFGYKTGAFVSAWPLTAHLTQLDRWFDTYDEELNRTYQYINSSRWAEDVTPKAISWLEEHDTKDPFFLWVHYFDPHSPYDFREGFEASEPSGNPDRWAPHGGRERVELIRTYDSEVLYTDHYLQKLFDALDKRQLTDSTLVVLTSDHGECLGEYGFRGHGSQSFENILHVPLILRWPGTLPEGRVVRQRVTLLDLAPTIIDLTVRRSQPDQKIPATFAGRSLAGHLLEERKLLEQPVHFAVYSGQKWIAPKWISWLWLWRGELDFPLRMGRIFQDRKVTWMENEDELRVVDLNTDPLELEPSILDDDSPIYEKETARLARWYEATALTEGESQMTEADRNALRSLGYLQ